MAAYVGWWGGGVQNGMFLYLRKVDSKKRLTTKIICFKSKS